MNFKPFSIILFVLLIPATTFATNFNVLDFGAEGPKNRPTTNNN